MKLTPYGAARMTTGSRHLLEVGGARVLLDCGLAEGKREASRARNASFPFDPASLDAVILSHAHIDHSGNLPNLVRHGFAGNIYATPATRDLCGIMLQDSAKIQHGDAAYVNKKRAKQGLPPVEPLYSREDAERTMSQFVSIDYRRRFPVVDGVRATFHDAGHMLGSAQVALDLSEAGRQARLLFSGDVGRGHGTSEILRDPEPVDGVDVLLMESTYGDRLHEATDSASDFLCSVVNRTRERGGKVLIPSFAVGRAQGVVLALHKLRDIDCYPALPIFVDSPLSVNATEVFRLHPECFNADLYEYLQKNKNPFGWGDIRYIREVEQSRELNTFPGSAIIISASGMCEAGRILHHLRNHIGDARNTVLFVGYCAENTLGAQLLRGEKRVRIFGEEFDVRAEIVKIDAYSGHADRDELLAYASRVGGTKRKIALVHGEEHAGLAFQKSLQAAYPGSEVVLPHEGDAIEF
ncbi:metallo-beta-lactamase family protein [Verrucomicrobium sp. GAS474]|uniref:MBL fold metallo-hydrolase RNA specificity domain-containing protein n=1 Tax=Verrucomicrobium sp. GAS474 TaxID=1882831 RepID=UPI0008794C4C|nr:MBL fold metallo-hydrolase [Verrucomicrobium sp. GAS474]SDT91824.1 metallo-beta-lactamase family protein [Verrucomicrobium sp. GAS474]